MKDFITFAVLAKIILISTLAIIGLTIISLPIHEFGHWLSSNMMGVPGHINIDWQNLSGTFYNSWGYASMTSQHIMELSGGFLVAIVYLLVSLFLVKIRPFLVVIAFAHLGYAFTEIGYNDLFIWLGISIGVIISISTFNKVIESYYPIKKYAIKFIS
jgi:hypothetical protein